MTRPSVWRTWHVMMPVAALLLVQSSARAIEPGRPLTQCVLDKWQAREGLPHDDILTISQTADGYLWFGTQGGACRFDGNRFTLLVPPADSTLGGGYPRKLFRARDGGLWVPALGSLWRVRDGRLQECPATPFQQGDELDTVAEDASGAIWVSALNRGVYVCHQGAWKLYTMRDGLLSHTVHCICGAADGSVWLGTDRGLNRFKDGRFIAYTTANGLPHDLVRCLYEAAGVLWVGTDGGLGRLCQEQFVTYTVREGLPSNQVRGLAPGRADTLWVATAVGVARGRAGKFETYTSRNGLSSDALAAVYESSDGSLWLGTAEGLNRLKDSQVTVYGRPEGSSDEFTWSVCDGHDGSIWIGTNSGGVCRLKDGQFTPYTARDGLPNHTARGLFEDREHRLWVATYGGVCCMSPVPAEQSSSATCYSFKTYTTHDGLLSNRIYAVYQDRTGTIWCGTPDGACFLRGSKWVAYLDSGAPRELVRAFTEDASGALWAATHNGLVRFEPGQNRCVTFTENGLRFDVLAVTSDAAGNVWAATDGGGLARYRGGQIRCYTSKDGLCDDVLYQVVADNDGSLWLGCRKGIFHIAPKELDEIDAGIRTSVIPVLYNTLDGMRASECNGGNQSAACRTRDGRLCFATMRGIVELDPKQIRAASIRDRSSGPQLPVLLEEVLVNHGPVDPRRTTDLVPGKRELEFRYTALSFLAPERLQFRYRLEGYDAEWVHAGRRREAYYTNLPPGHYRFRVQARSSAGQWTEAKSVFSFRLRPSFYQSWWFFALASLVLAGVAFAAHKLRVRLLERREEDLRQRVQARTRELQEAETAARLAKEHAEAALAQVKQLRGLLPICAYCKKIRDDGDYWHQLEAYLCRHSEAQFSHGICPDCYVNLMRSFKPAVLGAGEQ